MKLTNSGISVSALKPPEADPRKAEEGNEGVPNVCPKLPSILGFIPSPKYFLRSFTLGSAPNMSVRPGQIRAASQDGVAMIPSAISMRYRYQELTMPVVIMAGAKDGVVNVKQPHRLHAQIPHSNLLMVPGVGHMLHYAVPEEVTEAIEQAAGPAVTLSPARRVSHAASAA